MVLSKTLVVFLIGVSLGACAADDNGPKTDDDGTSNAATIKITGQDYAFLGVPATIESGTKVQFTNVSNKEVHEIIALRINDDETRSAADLLKLPKAESEELSVDKGFLVALPGEEGSVPPGQPTAGDTDFELTEAGRYIFACFIPFEADPAALFASHNEHGNDDATPAPGLDGPPHVTKGMFAEVTVEDGS